ncbi:PPC domain-containing protein [Candidatus Poribacteria bacterium]|nr:PPC domain-containing protein [Candidatus Poribacteria bacterium]
MPIKHCLLPLSIFLLTISVAYAQVVPALSTVSPQGAQQGQNIEITLTGKNLDTVTAVWFSGKGITAEIKHGTQQAAVLFNGAGVSGRIATDAQLTASLTIAPNAPLGIQQMRIVTPYGVSNALNFVVGSLPEISEDEAIEKTEMSNWLELPVTVNGEIASIDDEDRFSFDLKKDARLICEVTAQRLGSPLDSYLVLQDANGAEVANSGQGNGLDSLLDYTALETGKYTLHIRDIRYKGGSGFRYRLSVGELPYLETIFPLGAQRGTDNAIAVTGANLGTVNAIQVAIDPETPKGQQTLRVQTPSGLASNSHPFSIGSLAEMGETEPNNTAEKANAVNVPITINGKIDDLNDSTSLSGDIDRFSFEIKEPQLLVFEVEALRLSSKLDALLTLYGAKKQMEAGTDMETYNAAEEQVLMVNDDASGTDARVEWNFTEAGKYSVAIRDLNNQGGETYPYRLNIRPLEPNFTLSAVVLDSQNRPSGLDSPRVSRGGTFTMQVNVGRLDRHTGPIRLYCPTLPKTFEVSPAVVEVGQNKALLTVTAPWDAPLGLMPFTVAGISAVGNRQVERTATPSPMLLTVMEAPEFTLTLAEISTSVTHNKSVSLHVTANRRADFTGPITLSVVGLPPRVTAASVNIAEGQNEAVLSVKAGSFERREQFSVVPVPGINYISVVGTAKVGRETVSQSTPAIPLTILEAPFIVTVEPLRFSIVFPATVAANLNDSASLSDADTIAQTGTVAIAANPSADLNDSASFSESSLRGESDATKEAILTLTIVRQGGFTDEVTLTPLDLPEGFTTEAVTIPVNETEIKVPLKALGSLEDKTYQFKFRGSATINGKVFEQDSPILNAKIIH